MAHGFSVASIQKVVDIQPSMHLELKRPRCSETRILRLLGYIMQPRKNLGRLGHLMS